MHAGTYRVEPATNAVRGAVYHTTSYQVDSTEHAATLRGLKEFGNIYARFMNPTPNVLSEPVAEH